MKINRYSRGSVSIVVLLACVVLSGAVQALYYSLREEIEAVNKPLPILFAYHLLLK